MTGSYPLQVDVRPVSRPQRHAIITRIFDALAPGDSFELVNDHDPVGLRHRFNQLIPGAFTWEYLIEGPAEWRVRIGRP